MDFRVGGFWLYAMVGPNGEKHWARVDFKKIDVNKYFEAADTFCDENGIANSDLAGIDWRNEFLTTDNGTKVVVVLTFKNLSDLEKLIEMGFKEGFIAALGNLDDLI